MSHNHSIGYSNHCQDPKCEAVLHQGEWFLPMEEEPLYLTAPLPGAPKMLVVNIQRKAEVAVEFNCIWFNTRNEIQQLTIPRCQVDAEIWEME